MASRSTQWAELEQLHEEEEDAIKAYYGQLWGVDRFQTLKPPPSWSRSRNPTSSAAISPLHTATPPKIQSATPHQ